MALKTIQNLMTLFLKNDKTLANIVQDGEYAHPRE
jgi:hypothetical protein